MSIGEVLADARCRLGLSVSEVSRRTRIRATIIWGIEQDDYSACGGDFYVRGHIRAISAAVGIDPVPLIRQFDAAHQKAEEDITAVVALRPAAPSRTRPGSRAAGIAALCVAVLAIVGWGAYHVASAAGHPPGSKALAAADRVAASHQDSHGKPGPSPSPPSPSPAPARATARPAPAVVPARAPARALAPAGALAFGPGGPGQGDNPQTAGLAIDGSGATAWHSDWYTTAEFGNLESGTGLLIDMGRPVTVTAAQITLGGLPGATLQLRAGNVPALPDLGEIASAAGAGGPVDLQLTRTVRARYLLIWFTRLPPDTAGTYQASISRVALQGRP
ncbi:MAG: helix-turn-helix domain-containing protein [Streptosporangiaceae bacterium]